MGISLNGPVVIEETPGALLLVGLEGRETWVPCSQREKSVFPTHRILTLEYILLLQSGSADS